MFSEVSTHAAEVLVECANGLGLLLRPGRPLNT